MLLAVLACTLTAGLWPFRSPTNDVSWLDRENGIHLGKHGMLVSAESLRPSPGDEAGPVSVELWVRPAPYRQRAAFFAVFRPERPRQFSIRQYQTGFVLGMQPVAERSESELVESFVDNAFRAGEPTLITIASDGRETRVFVNGAPGHPSRPFSISSRELTGQLVLGNSPLVGNSWSGDLLGVAIYSRKLKEDEVRRDYALWTEKLVPDPARDGGLLTLFPFDERRGTFVRNRVEGQPGLRIPSRYTVVHKALLRLPWAEYQPSASYWMDMAVNVAGFMPLGFVVFAYLSLRKAKPSGLTALLIGAATSLTIEVWQAYLPTRDSGVTDLITNTVGTYLGIAVCKSVLSRWLRAV